MSSESLWGLSYSVSDVWQHPRSYILDLHKDLEYEEISLIGLPFENEDAFHIGALTGLKLLFISRAIVTDSGLEIISKLTNLRRLEISFLTPDQRITDQGFSQLANLSKLRRLQLGNVHILEDGFFHLAKLSNLENLTIDCEQITEIGFRHLTGLKNLKYLTLDCEQIDKDGLEHISELTKLKSLVILNNSLALDIIFLRNHPDLNAKYNGSYKEADRHRHSFGF